jgi:hypothetical protein
LLWKARIHASIRTFDPEQRGRLTLVEPALVKNVVPRANSLPSDPTFSIYGKQTVKIGG